MTDTTRYEELRIARPTGIAMLALVAAAFAVAGILAGQGDAAAYTKRYAKLPAPTLRHGLLTIDGSRADDRIALRLKAGDAGTLQVDFGDDGSAEAEVPRADVTRIAVRAANGDDFVRIDEVNGVFTDAIPTTMSGGRGDDTLAGGSGAEVLVGRQGDDSIDGNRGNDQAFMGAGDDTFVWDPGDGSDTVEGQFGRDTMLFNGNGANERFDLSANGPRLRFFRDAGSITMDTDDVERVDLNALGGVDVVTVNDLSGTDLDALDVDESSPADSGAGDGQADQVIVNGTNGDDAIVVAGSNGTARVRGLRTAVTVTGAEPANDTLTINALGGDDVVDAGGLSAGVIKLSVDGGNGDDVLQGSAGDDVMAGGAGDDVLIGGPGRDVLDGGPGSNVVLQ